MARLFWSWTPLLLAALAAAFTGCSNDDESETGNVPDTGNGDSDADGDGDAGPDGDSDNDTDWHYVPEKCEECSGFKGVDILVVVDNSNSMGEEQEILATGFFTLINSLVNPIDELDRDPAEDVRVAVVSSDLGLQYGEDGDFYNGVSLPPGCEELGDDGAFQIGAPGEVMVSSGEIRCDDGENQCPAGDWECDEGFCVAADGEDEGPVDCPDIDGDWTGTSATDDLAVSVSCMAQLGDEGCGAEQQLRAGVRALTRSDQADFIRDDRLLAVMVVSDEEDCSIADKALFETDEWKDDDTRNTSCNAPSANGDLLFEISALHDDLVGLKDGQEYAVLFAAIVGVPDGDDSPCQGLGDEIGDCLDDDRMTYSVREFNDILDDNGKPVTYRHFAPACERREGDVVVTSARPGRRYVELAEAFGCMGYVYSICNADWSDAMSEIARLIAECISILV